MNAKLAVIAQEAGSLTELHVCAKGTEFLTELHAGVHLLLTIHPLLVVSVVELVRQGLSLTMNGMAADVEIIPTTHQQPLAVLIVSHAQAVQMSIVINQAVIVAAVLSSIEIQRPAIVLMAESTMLPLGHANAQGAEYLISQAIPASAQVAEALSVVHASVQEAGSLTELHVRAKGTEFLTELHARVHLLLTMHPLLAVLVVRPVR
ncbi:MAG: hypothetical protein HQM16_19360 [Deltaproteobacteria bacterium]|nr:hypothetical protein [Deltaproteobacteria bacterium]